MIDIKIQNIDKITVAEQRRVFNKNTILSEKVDGTKLNVIVTGDKSCIISFKGFIIYPFEFDFIDGRNALDKSIGFSQYIQVVERMRYRNWKEMGIPPGAQLFFEFVQRKKTLTRQYNASSYHQLFLVGVGDCEYWTQNGMVFTIEKESTFVRADVSKVAEKLKIKMPPLLPRLTDESDFETYKTFILNNFMENGVLGGIPEGVVIETDGRFYKVINKGQYDPKVRRKIKQKYDADPEHEEAYWRNIHKFARTLVEVTGIDQGLGFEKSLKCIADLCYDSVCPIPHPKRNGIKKQDDLFLTCKTLLINEFNCNFKKRVGLYPMAGKPVHAGHWNMIERASSHWEHVIIFVSEKDRKINRNSVISGNVMKQVWKNYLMPELPENCTVVFCDNPTTSVMHYISFYNMFKDTLGKHFSIYSDIEDCNKFEKIPNITNVGLSRANTVHISGTEMRKFLSEGDEGNFVRFLPNVKNKKEIWKSIRKNVDVE